MYEGKMEEQAILNRKAKGKLVAMNPQDHETDTDKSNRFFFGDNEEILRLLLPEIRGKVDLIYIDPPFGTGQDFADIDNTHAYSDGLLNHEFLEFLRRRLFLLRECLSEQGSIYLHIDKKIGHYVRVIMDEVFGYENFLNDISRIKCNPKNFARKAYGNYSDMILFYAKNKDENIFNHVPEVLTEAEKKKLFPKHHPEHGRYTTHPLHAPGTTQNGDTGQAWKGLFPPQGRHWRYSREVLDQLEADGLIEWSDTGNPRKIVFAKDHTGKKTQDVWTFKDKGLSYVSYPTQKNAELLRRILLNSSNPDSLVMDAFAGSGSFLMAAEQVGRRWIGIDRSEQAFRTIQANLDERGIRCSYFELSVG